MTDEQDKSTTVPVPDSSKIKLRVPSEDALAKYTPGSTTMRYCGWCQYAGTGVLYKGCNIECKCGLIPLPESAAEQMPPVERLIAAEAKSPEMKAFLEAYDEDDKRDTLALQGHRNHRAFILKLLKQEGLRDKPCEVFERLTWDTQCVLVASLANTVFKAEVLKRLNFWIQLIAQRRRERKELVDALVKKRKDVMA